MFTILSFYERDGLLLLYFASLLELWLRELLLLIGFDDVRPEFDETDLLR